MESEKQYEITICTTLKNIALDKYSDESVGRIVEDLRQELVDVLNTGLVSRGWYRQWDRILSGVHWPDFERDNEDRLAEMKYGAVEDERFPVEVEIYDGEPEGKIISRFSMDQIFNLQRV